MPPISTIGWSRVGDRLLMLAVKALKKESLQLQKTVAQLQKQVAALQAKSVRSAPTRAARGGKGPAAAK